MPKIIGVRFRDAGKVYYFDPGENTIRYHDHVIVETARGVEYGTVVLSPTEIAAGKVNQPLKSVIRMATEEDTARENENRAKEKEAYRICKQKIAEHNLEMKLIEAEYTFDNSKVLFYFTADGRIDFRDLVKDLASVFRTRIELRQIGVRDETKLLGGIGGCGRPLCCHTWLNDFAPVSIKMAKDQNLSLNPAKISGTCGRLMCCLKNEAETYAELNKGLPGKGDYVTTPDGLHGDVASVNILRQTVKVIVDLGNDEKEMQEFEVKDITFIPKSKKPKNHEEPKKEGGKKGRKGARDEQGGEDRKRSRKGAPEDARAGENAANAGAPGTNGSEAPGREEDPDLQWNPNMEKFDASDYLIREDAGKGGQRPKRERKKKAPRQGDGQGEGREEAGHSAEGRGARDPSKKSHGGRQKNRGDQAKPEGEHAERAAGEGRKSEHRNQRPGGENRGADRTAEEAGAQEARGGEHAEGEEAAKRHPRRKRRPHHRTPKEEGAAQETRAGSGAPAGENE